MGSSMRPRWSGRAALLWAAALGYGTWPARDALDRRGESQVRRAPRHSFCHWRVILTLYIVIHSARWRSLYISAHHSQRSLTLAYKGG